MTSGPRAALSGDFATLQQLMDAVAVALGDREAYVDGDQRVTFGEWLTYNPPKKGGKPNVSFNKLGGKTVRETKCKAATGPHCKKKRIEGSPVCPHCGQP